MPAPLPPALPGPGAPGASGASPSSGSGTAPAGAPVFETLVAALLAARERGTARAPSGPAGQAAPEGAAPGQQATGQTTTGQTTTGRDPVRSTPIAGVPAPTAGQADRGEPVRTAADEEPTESPDTVDAAEAQASGLGVGTAGPTLPTPLAAARHGAAGVLHGTVVHTLSRRGPDLGTTDEAGVPSSAAPTGPADAEAATIAAAPTSAAATAATTVPAPPTGAHPGATAPTPAPTAPRPDGAGDDRGAGGAPTPAVEGPGAGPRAGDAAPTAGTGSATNPSAEAAPTGAPLPPPPGTPTVQAQSVVASTAQLGAPVSLTPTQSRALVADQVAPAVTRLVEAGPGTHRLVLRLDPEELGPVRVTLTLHQGTVSVRLAAGSAEARAALADGSPELHRLLGTHAGETRVSVHDLAAPGLAHVAEPRSSDASGSGPGAREGAEQQGAASRGADATTSGGGRSGTRSGEQERHAGTRAESSARDGTTVTATRPGLSDPLSSGRVRLDVSI